MTLIIVLFAILMATNAFKIENHRPRGTRRPTGPPLAPFKPFPIYELEPTTEMSDDDFEPTTENQDDFEPTTTSDDYEDSFPRNLNPDSSGNDTSEVTAHKCYYAHKLCPQTIPPLKSKYGLENIGIFTASSCDCDLTYYECLKSVNDFWSNKKGKAYFNTWIISIHQCFKEDYPITGCKNYTSRWFPRKRCTEYSFDTSKPKKNQWFDLPFY